MQRKESSLGWTSALALVALLALAVGCQVSVGSSDGDGDGATPASEKKGEDGDKKGQGKDGKAEEEKKEEAVPVEVAALDRGAIESVLRFSSNLETESEVQVLSEAARRVTELLVEEGHRVRRGQTLLRLQDEEQRSALAKTKSQLEKAAREYERQKRLWDQELISEEAFNNATYELEQLEISLADAERELSYTEVRAPISGTITVRHVNLGDHVQIGEQLFDIVDFESMVARVFVPEKNLGELRVGLPARIEAQASNDSAFNGKIKRIAPVVDPRSGTVKVTVDVGNQRGLRPGMYVDVDLVTATKEDALLVPKRALIYDNDQMFVFRLSERRVERVLVAPALADKFNVNPLMGFEVGDQVVVAGQAGLKDGALVKLPGDEEDDEVETTGDAEMQAGDEDDSDGEDTFVAEAN